MSNPFALPQQPKAMTFRRFQEINRLRCKIAFPMCEDWTLNDWATALAGEVGEMCNEFKKIRRGDEGQSMPIGQEPKIKPDNIVKIRKELADIITYADLLMTMMQADTERELMSKFNEVSAKKSFDARNIEATHFVLPRGTNSMVKEAEFFRLQQVNNSEWGRQWIPVKAHSIDQARELATHMPTVDERFPPVEPYTYPNDRMNGAGMIEFDDEAPMVVYAPPPAAWKDNGSPTSAPMPPTRKPWDR